MKFRVEYLIRARMKKDKYINPPPFPPSLPSICPPFFRLPSPSSHHHLSQPLHHFLSHLQKSGLDPVVIHYVV